MEIISNSDRIRTNFRQELDVYNHKKHQKFWHGISLSLMLLTMTIPAHLGASLLAGENPIRVDRVYEETTFDIKRDRLNLILFLLVTGCGSLIGFLLYIGLFNQFANIDQTNLLSLQNEFYDFIQDLDWENLNEEEKQSIQLTQNLIFPKSPTNNNDFALLSTLAAVQSSSSSYN